MQSIGETLVQTLVPAFLTVLAENSFRLWPPQFMEKVEICFWAILLGQLDECIDVKGSFQILGKEYFTPCSQHLGNIFENIIVFSCCCMQ